MRIFAHRGDSGRYPENTMLAFRQAAKTGCDGIELDVQLTRDGEVVIIHDETIDRTTNGTGMVRDYTLKELKTWNADMVQGNRYGFEPIPTLREYCAWVREQDLVTNIEIKSGVFYYKELEEKTLHVIREFGLENKIIFSSFNHMSVTLLTELAPDIPCGALVDRQGLGNAGYYCSKFGFACYHPGAEGVSEDTIKECRDHNVAVNVWTVNDLWTLEKLWSWGCDGVISNYPGMCVEWLRQQEDRSSSSVQ